MPLNRSASRLPLDSAMTRVFDSPRRLDPCRLARGSAMRAFSVGAASALDRRASAVASAAAIYPGVGHTFSRPDAPRARDGDQFARCHVGAVEVPGSGAGASRFASWLALCVLARRIQVWRAAPRT